MPRRLLASLTLAALLLLAPVSSLGFDRGVVLAQDALQKLNDEIKKLDEEILDLAKRQRELNDEIHRNRREAQDAEGHADRVRELKAKADRLGTDLADVEGKIRAKIREVDDKAIELRKQASDAIAAAIEAARAHVKDGRKADARTELLAAKSRVRDWELGRRKWREYAHQAGALDQPALPERKARAESELKTLEEGLKRVTEESARLKSEQERIDALSKSAVDHDDFKPLTDRLAEYRAEVTKQADALKKQSEGLEKRRGELRRYVGAK